MENCEAMTSSTHSFAYSYGLVKKCFLKICKTSKCYNCLIFQPIFIRFSLFCSENFTLSSEFKLDQLRTSPLSAEVTTPAFRLGPVYRGQFGEVISFLRPTIHTVFSNAPTFRGQSRLSGFGCVLDHSATTFGACAHLRKTAVRYQLRAQGRSLLSWTQHVWWDHREKSQ